MRAAREALAAGRLGEFAERALRLEAESASWTLNDDVTALRREADSMKSLLAHVAAVRDRLLALRGSAGGYRADGSPAAPTSSRLRREA